MDNNQQGPQVQSEPDGNSPIGTTVMNTEVLKEPRGFIRVLEFFLAIIAFASCLGFTTYFEYNVQCNNGTTITVRHDIAYPFRLDHQAPVEVSCGPKTYEVYPPGDLKSDAEFFVFTGIFAMFASAVSLMVYIGQSPRYLEDKRSLPLIDFFVTFGLTTFWLAGSAAFANGVTILKTICADTHENWIYTADYSICKLGMDTGAEACEITFVGKFGGGNATILLGFLNAFLWGSNIWFVFKETTYFLNFSNSSGTGQRAQQLPS